MLTCKEISEYIDFVRSEESVMCKEQYLLADMVERAFETEDIYVDQQQLDRYMAQQKHFPFALLPWEKYIFALHNCTYKANGTLRFPRLVCIVGRGAGKNGYLAFEDFCLITPVNGIRNYNIDMFATSEDQAKTSFKDIYNVLDDNKEYFKNYFSWNQVVIRNLKTKSEIRYHTRAPGTKDGARPGKIDFDEYHAYENYKLINVIVTGLGKVKRPRRTIVSSQGDIRDGPLDKTLEDAMDVLNGENPDNGTIYFICRLDDDKEIDNPDMWPKANPSLIYMPDLMEEIKEEYEDYKKDPLNNSGFATKRMNRPQGDTENNVTAWENIKATNQDIPDLHGESCVCGIDYTKTNDFMAAGLLFHKGDKRYWITHSWVCRKSADLHRIKYPLKEAEGKGLLSYVDDVDISPEIVTNWIKEQAKIYKIEHVALDNYRYTLVKPYLKAIGFEAKRKDGNVTLVQPSNIMKTAPIIGSCFLNHNIVYGDNSLMRWYTRNTKGVVDGKGNISYEKIEPKSRKTDGFMAFVAAMCVEEKIKEKPVVKNIPTLVFN